jgi:hypothetical protein
MQPGTITYNPAFRPLPSVQERADIPALTDLNTLRGGGGVNLFIS